jgi:hypothetical protein
MSSFSYPVILSHFFLFYLKHINSPILPSFQRSFSYPVILAHVHFPILSSSHTFIFLSCHPLTLSHVHFPILSSSHTFILLSCHLKYIHSPILASFHRSFSYILSSSHTFIFLFFHPLIRSFFSLVINLHVLLSIPIIS